MVLQILDTSRMMIDTIAIPYNLHIHTKLEGEQSGIGTEILYFSARAKDHIDALKVENYVETEEQRYIIKEIHAAGDRVDVAAVVDNDDFFAAEPTTWFWVVGEKMTPQDWFVRINYRLTAAGAPSWTLVTDVTTGVTFGKDGEYVNRTPWEYLCYGVQKYGAEAWINAKTNTVYMYKQRGSDKGAYFTRDLNLKSLALDATSYELFTRLYVDPNDASLDIDEVNTNTPGEKYVELRDTVDKLLCAKWVPDEEDDTAYTSAADVFTKAMSMITELSRPVTAYSVDVVDLAEANPRYRQILDYNIGDTVLLANHIEDKLQKHRIVELDRYPDDASKNTAVLSSKPLDILRTITRMQNYLKNAEQTLSEMREYVRTAAEAVARFG